MKKLISLLVVVLTMTLGFSFPAFAASDFGTVNQFTIEQTNLDMDITIDVTMDLMPVIELQVVSEPIYLEGVVIMYPHLEDGYTLQLDRTALEMQALIWKNILDGLIHSSGHITMLSSMNRLRPETNFLAYTHYNEGPPWLEVYEDNVNRHFRKTYM